ncbi:S8/S53 family peptidase [bacterium]|nr:S8/S53 family peptidase [bacterium]
MLIICASLTATCAGRGEGGVPAEAASGENILANTGMANTGGAGDVAKDTGGTGAGGKPGPPGGGGGVFGAEGGGCVDPYPLVPQDLRDLGGANIGPWGPVIATHMVEVEPGVMVTVNELGRCDPFTGIYQLEDGTLIVSNEPLENIAARDYTSAPPTFDWQFPGGNTFSIFEGEMLVEFVQSATQLDIELFIAEHNLHVISSWFKPPEPPASGNDLAWFHFQYDQVEFPTFDSAFLFFSGHPLVDTASPNTADRYRPDYVQGDPGDYYYTIDESEFVDVLEIDASSLVDMGPPDGEELSDQVVAVLDTGVYRYHPDFEWASKLTDIGVNAYHVAREIAAGGGHPDFMDEERGGLVAHGTKVAGVITAITYPTGIPWNEGIPSVAPRACVLPMRYEVVDSPTGIAESTVFEAVLTLFRFFRHGKWKKNGEDVRVRVVNMSFVGRADIIIHLGRYINVDVSYNDRLYVAAAGNDGQIKRSYPAAYYNVLGVTGIWVAPDGDVDTQPYEDYWFAQVPGQPGSNYINDNYNTYPISGIFGFAEVDVNRNPIGREEVGRSTSPHAGNPGYGLYDDFWGTSAATPQVAGLACLLYTRNKNATFLQVRDRIAITRNLQIELVLAPDRPIAGPVMFDAALDGWGE